MTQSDKSRWTEKDSSILSLRAKPFEPGVDAIDVPMS
jgi:hypothetical protein